MKPPWISRAAARKKPIVDWCLGWLACAVLASAAAPPRIAAQAVDEAAGVKRICATGPSANLARAERQTGDALVREADVLPNPSLVIEHQRSLSGPSEQETIVGLSVPLGIGGRRSLLQDAAAARNQQASASAEVTLFESALSFREAYAAAAIDRARVAVLEQQQAMLDELSTTIAGLTKGGETAQYDLLRQNVHARLHRRELESAKARAVASLALVEAWLGEKIALPLGDLFALAGGAGADGRSIDAFSSSHSSLRSLEAQARAGGLEARAAERRWVPDLQLFAGYRMTRVSEETGHGVALELDVPLTFFDHGQGEAARARAEQALATANAESLRRTYDARLRSVDAQLTALAASVAQLEPALAEAASLQDKARQLYGAGEASITELLEAFRAAEEARLGLIDLARELALLRLDRMRAAGTLLDPTLDKACNVTQRRPE